MAEFDGRIGHLEGIESQWSNGGGVAKTREDVERLCMTGVGGPEVGSITPLERTKQGPHHFNPITGEMFNAVEMNNCGLEKFLQWLPDMLEVTKAHNKPLIVNVATVTDKPAEEAVELVRRVQDAGGNVLYNPDCPSIIDADGNRLERLTNDPARFGKVLMALAAADLREPIFVRIAPQKSWGYMNLICSYLKASNIVSAVYVSNSEQVEDSPIGPAGKSGPAMAGEGFKQTSWAASALKARKPGDKQLHVVSSIGINNAKELQRRLNIDPIVVAGVGTTAFYVPHNGWKEDVNQVLTELAS